MADHDHRRLAIVPGSVMAARLAARNEMRALSRDIREGIAVRAGLDPSLPRNKDLIAELLERFKATNPTVTGPTKHDLDALANAAAKRARRAAKRAAILDPEVE